jgi:nitrogen fixation NifU-like protein
MMWFSILVATGLMMLLVTIWFGIYYLLTPHVKNADGKARVTGTCSDTMEIRLRFNRNRVVETSYWTNGCVYSLNCICVAADLAKGKTPEEIFEIDANTVQKTIGGLPSDHMHCATLAVDTLQEAVSDYMRKSLVRSPLTSDTHRFSSIRVENE